MSLLQHVRNQSIGVVALFIALGGTGYAAATLPKNSVGSAQIKNGTVTSADVKDKSLTSADFAGGLPSGAAGKDGAPGAAGAAGPQGVAGPTGPQGPSGAAGSNGTAGAAGATGATGATGAAGSARAFALVNPANCTGSPTATCTVTRAKGITAVTRVDTGIYCVAATGLDPATSLAMVAVESASTTVPQSMSSAWWLNSSLTNCPAGTFAVHTVRNAGKSVRNADNSGQTTVPDFGDTLNNGVGFTILIP